MQVVALHVHPSLFLLSHADSPDVQQSASFRVLQTQTLLLVSSCLLDAINMFMYIYTYLFT